MKPFREEGIPAVLQIEDYENDFNRYYHSAGDSVAHMDHEYWLEQMRAAVAAIAHLAIPYSDTPPASPTSPPTPTPTATSTRSPSAVATVQEATVTPSAVASATATSVALATEATEAPIVYHALYMPMLLRSGN